MLRSAGTSRDGGGTFFTVALTTLLGGRVKEFDRNQDNLVEWHEFYRVLRTHTAQLASSHGNAQNTMVYSIPSPLRNSVAAAK